MFVKYFIIVLLFLVSCTNNTSVNESSEVDVYDFSIDVIGVPNDTIRYNDSRLKLKEGIYYKKDRRYSGHIKKYDKKNKSTTYSSVYKGELHGKRKVFFENGNISQEKSYKNNLVTGRHMGYWKESGKLMFDYLYFEDKKVGHYKRWYSNGKPYVFKNFKDNKLHGLQQAWRENGQLYLNFDAVEGKRFGLNRSKPCFGIEGEKLDLQYDD